MAESARLLIQDAGTPAWNMAVDEAVLLHADSLKLPTLRVYRWDRPALSLGYFQKASDAEAYAPGVEFVRRYTGGGLVDHRADVTYTMVLPPGHAWLQLTAPQSYKRVHEGVLEALTELGIRSALTPCCDTNESNACFEKAVQFDLKLLRPDGTPGEKVAGAAQRRTRHGLLQQGSILLPEVIQQARATVNDELRAALPAAMGRAFAMQWLQRDQLGEGQDQDGITHLAPEEVAIAKRLERERYAAAEWNNQR